MCLPMSGSDVEYAVIDVETTGLAARRYDRVIEIAVLRLSATGCITDRYVTLVNPNRDVGPTDIHGITASDLVHAPVFECIAGDVLQRLQNAVVVGHNVIFDATFLRAEFERLGHALPEFPTLCTLRLTSMLGVPVPCRTLEACCAYFGIPVRCHAAESDASATAALLLEYLAILRDRHLRSEEVLGDDSRYHLWELGLGWLHPVLASAAIRPRCSANANRSYLARFVARLPELRRVQPGASNITAYLELLDRVLEDRLVTKAKSDELYCVAHDLGLSANQVKAAHRDYLRSLAQAASANGVVTEMELSDLEQVARLFGLDSATVKTLLDETHGIRESGSPEEHCPRGHRPQRFNRKERLFYWNQRMLRGR